MSEHDGRIGRQMSGQTVRLQRVDNKVWGHGGEWWLISRAGEGSTECQIDDLFADFCLVGFRIACQITHDWLGIRLTEHRQDRCQTTSP